MANSNQLQIGASGTEYFFAENEDLVKWLEGLYPRLSFQTSLSLSNWPQSRNLHVLPVTCPITEGLTYDSVTVQSSLVNALLKFLDSVVQSMTTNKAYVYLSRIETGSSVNPKSLKTELYGHLRAVFIQE